MTEKIDMDEKAKALAVQIPEVMKAMSGLHSEVVKDGALSAKIKELMMVGIAVALRCEYCLWKHVPEAVKSERLSEIIALQNRLSAKSKKNDVGKVYEVLIEGFSKRSNEHLSGRTSQNKVVVFPAGNNKKGEYVDVLVERSTSATLIGKTI